MSTRSFAVDSFAVHSFAVNSFAVNSFAVDSFAVDGLAALALAGAGSGARVVTKAGATALGARSLVASALGDVDVRVATWPAIEAGGALDRRLAVDSGGGARVCTRPTDASVPEVAARSRTAAFAGEGPGVVTREAEGSALANAVIDPVAKTSEGADAGTNVGNAASADADAGAACVVCDTDRAASVDADG